MSKTIEYKLREGAKSTKEVLGEHLYHKISQALKQYEFNPDLQLESRLTGMILELPARDVTVMLASDGILRLSISQALCALVKLVPELESIATAFEEESKMSLTQDDIGTLVYTSVAKLEPALASKITGMLLELDTSTLLNFLSHEDTIFPAAVEKAKKALECSTEQQLSIDPSVFPLSRERNGDYELEKSQAKLRNGYIDDDILLTQLGSLIYKKAFTTHPECAANITGMLLELDVSCLTDIVRDQDKLNKAIDKSFRAWHASLS